MWGRHSYDYLYDLKKENIAQENKIRDLKRMVLEMKCYDKKYQTIPKPHESPYNYYYIPHLISKHAQTKCAKGAKRVPQYWVKERSDANVVREYEKDWNKGWVNWDNMTEHQIASMCLYHPDLKKSCRGFSNKHMFPSMVPGATGGPRVHAFNNDPSIGSYYKDRKVFKEVCEKDIGGTVIGQVCKMSSPKLVEAYVKLMNEHYV